MKSDVFEFGILLWNLLMGEEPYAGMEGTQVAERLGRKLRLPLPVEKLGLSTVELLNQCWNEDPEKRPSFEKIGSILNDIWEGRTPSEFAEIISPRVSRMAEEELIPVSPSSSTSSLVLTEAEDEEQKQ
jgi:hypothetical protein